MIEKFNDKTIMNNSKFFNTTTSGVQNLEKN